MNFDNIKSANDFKYFFAGFFERNKINNSFIAGSRYSSFIVYAKRGQCVIEYEVTDKVYVIEYDSVNNSIVLANQGGCSLKSVMDRNPYGELYTGYGYGS